MTNYSAWDSKATALVREADKQDETEEAANNRSLGLDGIPKGPPTEKAESQLKDLSSHSTDRKEFIAWSQKREVTLTHEAQNAPVELKGPEFENMALRLQGSEGLTYIVPEGSRITKLMLDSCKRVRVQVCGSIVTSTIEVCRCEDVDVELFVPIGTIQVDECLAAVNVQFGEYDHIGRIYHANSPGLSLCWGSGDVHHIGQAGEVQLCTKAAAGENSQSNLLTVIVRRGEGEFPIDILGDSQANQATDSFESEADKHYRAEAKRQAGNEMFRASDFMQAAAEYTSALELDSSSAAVWGNRSQCWLKLGDHDKALADAQKCTELDPSSAKGWFRKGMSLHALQRYPEAILPLLEAEKLEPNNKQIPDAVKMAQLMARRQAGGA